MCTVSDRDRRSGLAVVINNPCRRSFWFQLFSDGILIELGAVCQIAAVILVIKLSGLWKVERSAIAVAMIRL